MTAIPTGTYQVTLYNWEDNNSETFNVLVNGATVATNVISGPTGTWKALGPYPVNITNGTLGVTTSGGTANLSGLVVTPDRRRRAGQPDADHHQPWGTAPTPRAWRSRHRPSPPPTPTPARP